MKCRSVSSSAILMVIILLLPGQSPATVSLSIFEEGSSEKPRQITDPEKFKSTPFDDLWNEATTLKVKLDRSIKDQLDERQYG
jgi:hypothetical protein